MPLVAVDATRKPRSSGVFAAVRPKTLGPSLRSGEPAGKGLSEERAAGRAVEGPILRRLAQLSDQEIARAIGSLNDARGAQVKAGSIRLTPGELAHLCDRDVGAAALAELIEEIVVARMQTERDRERRADLAKLVTYLRPVIDLLSA